MDTSIKRLLEVAGVDITQGKAKELCEEVEQNTGGLCVFTLEGEAVIEIKDVPATTTAKQWNIIWNKSLPKEVSDYYADENPDEGAISIEGTTAKEFKKPYMKISKEAYFRKLIRLAKQ